MIKLTKTKTTSWNGNGFGSDSAEWVVKGHEHIAIEQLGGKWVALDSTKIVLNHAGLEMRKRIASAFTKKDLLDVLVAKLAA